MPVSLLGLGLHENEYGPIPLEYSASNQQPADEKGPNMVSTRALTIESHTS